MFASLGSIIFQGLTAFESFERRDTTTYSQHDLISGKPRLQPIANDLEELTISLKLRAEFCDPAYNIRQLKGAKDNFEVMPLLMGNGAYVGDYVITEMGETHNASFSDGALIEAAVTLTLKEFVPGDKLLQQQQSQRKRAFAVNKVPVNIGLKTVTTLPREAAYNLAAINSEIKAIDGKVIGATNNVSRQHAIIKSIENGLTTVQQKIDKLNGQVQTLEAKYNPATIIAAATSVAGAVNGFKNILPSLTFPISNFNDLQLNNLQLQSSLLGLKQVSTILSYSVITRRG